MELGGREFLYISKDIGGVAKIGTVLVTSWGRVVDVPAFLAGLEGEKSCCCATP